LNVQWERLVDEFGEMLYRAAYQVLHHHGDAEDVVQDVLFEAFRKHQRDAHLPAGGLLRRMALLRAVDRLRGRKTAARIEDSDIADGVSTPENAIRQRELADQLRQAIAHLPERQAECFLLRHVEGLSNEDIAQTLRITPSAVSTALYKARGNLRKALDLRAQSEKRS
jgi:RNA polymerase sigma-70 factor (ECF subfamily)